MSLSTQHDILGMLTRPPLRVPETSNVTIWGESAGAGAVMFHLIANGGDNEGLFHQALADSASLSFLPPYTDGFIETLYQQFAINAYVQPFNLKTIISPNVSGGYLSADVAA